MAAFQFLRLVSSIRGLKIRRERRKKNGSYKIKIRSILLFCKSSLFFESVRSIQPIFLSFSNRSRELYFVYYLFSRDKLLSARLRGGTITLVGFVVPLSSFRENFRVNSSAVHTIDTSVDVEGRRGGNTLVTLFPVRGNNVYRLNIVSTSTN